MEANSTEQSQKGKEVFLNMVGLLGLNAEVKDKVSGRNIILSVSTDEPGRLIGRNGSSLDNVGLLMNRILKKTDNTFPKVIIDVDGYDKKPPRERRKPNNRRDKRARSAAMEKTIVLDDSAAEDKINVYVDHETDSIAPVTTVALNGPEKNNSRPQQKRGRDNRRDNNRNNRRDNRRDNNRSNNRQRNEDRAPKTENVTKSPAPQSKPSPAPAAASSAPAPQAKPSPAPAAASSAPAPQSKPSPAPAAASSAPAPQSKPSPAADKGGKPANKLHMQCRNTAKEVKRWGEDLLLPPLAESDCQKALEYFSNDKEVLVKIDNSRSYGDKKRVRVSLKK